MNSDGADGPVRAGWRGVAVPTEHGGWGFTLEPILLGLLVAHSATAWEISAAALGLRMDLAAPGAA